MSSASWFHYGLLFRNTVKRQTSPQTLLKHLMTFPDVLQRPEEYCMENITCPLWDLVLTDQAGSWKVNCRGQGLLRQLLPGEMGSNVSNLVFGNESVSVDSERLGLDFLSDSRFKIIPFYGLMDHHIFIKWRCKCCLQHDIWSEIWIKHVHSATN